MHPTMQSSTHAICDIKDLELTKHITSHANSEPLLKRSSSHSHSSPVLQRFHLLSCLPTSGRVLRGGLGWPGHPI